MCGSLMEINTFPLLKFVCDETHFVSSTQVGRFQLHISGLKGDNELLEYSALI